MNGWMGKILKIDVGTGEVAIDSTEPYSTTTWVAAASASG